MNTNWPKWINASICKHVTDQITAYPVYIEGQVQQTLEDVDLMILRVDGPIFKEQSKGYFKCEVKLNMLVQHLLDENLYKPDEMNGVVAVAFDQAIPLKEYTGAATQFGCLTKTDDPIVITPFGQVKPGVELAQSTVECHYLTELKE